jgi:hypothetical protein
MSDRFKTTIVVYANQTNEANVFLLFKKAFTDQWELLEQSAMTSCEEVGAWLAEYLGVKPNQIDMERIKYIQENVGTTRILVFRLEEGVLKRVEELNPNSLWAKAVELPRLLTIKSISKEIVGLLTSIQEWRDNLMKLKHGSGNPISTLAQAA